ncbi:MAG TPA: hypothetical protein VMO26_12420 [Vicinamibacterales bacterium]|nr:hypothetical protein [Vicinamibacterales bacterium]
MTFTSGSASARLTSVEDRRFRLGSFFEWLAAAVGVGALIWLLSVPVQHLMGPRVEAALVEEPAPVPPGIPGGATIVPVMYLLDGREIRYGDLHTQLMRVVPEKLVTGPVVRGAGLFGERQTRAYTVDGTQFFVVCERVEAGGAMRVTGIYLR